MHNKDKNSFKEIRVNISKEGILSVKSSDILRTPEAKRQMAALKRIKENKYA